MKQLICCFIKVQPARSGPRHSLHSEKRIPSPQRIPRGAKPVFVRLRRPNGVNFNETAHLLFHQNSASPEWPETLAAPRHGEPLARSPVFARLRRPNGVNFNGTAHLLFHQSSASLERPEALAAPRHGEPLARSPVFARLRRPNGVNLHLTVASRQMNVQPARSGPKKNPLAAAHPGERSRCLPASGGQTA